MNLIRQFVQFWIDFIFGDAWEVATGVGVTLLVIVVVIDRWGGETPLSFLLLGGVLLFTWVALMRVTAPKRRTH